MYNLNVVYSELLDQVNQVLVLVLRPLLLFLGYLLDQLLEILSFLRTLVFGRLGRHQLGR